MDYVKNFSILHSPKLRSGALLKLGKTGTVLVKPFDLEALNVQHHL